MFQCIYKITVLWIKVLCGSIWMDKISSCTCWWLLDGPRSAELRLPQRSHSGTLKQMRCIIKSLGMTSAVQTPQLLHSQPPFLLEYWSFHGSSQWRRAEHGACSDRGRHCSKGNPETCDYALTAVLPACWTAGNFCAVSLIYISQPCLSKVTLIIY